MSSEKATAIEIDEESSYQVHHDKPTHNGPRVAGTVRLLAQNQLILLPTPTEDPQDPLNLSVWRKYVIMLTIAFYGVAGLTMAVGLGAIFPDFAGIYIKEGVTGAELTGLITYTTLAMGFGNFFAIPVSLAIGRRPVFLVSCGLQAAASIWASQNTGYNNHLAARIVIGVAAGQSEALGPLIVQELFFLHERGRILTYLSTIQGITTSLVVMFSPLIVGQIGYRWWYGIFAIVSGISFGVALFLMPESKYPRSIDAYGDEMPLPGEFSAENKDAPLRRLDSEFNRVTTATSRHVDLTKYQPRTLKSDMRFWIPGTVDWSKTVDCWKQMFVCLMLPNVLWFVLMNGLFLGINVAIGSTYGTILTSPPYSWNEKWVGFSQAGQIVVGFLCVPLLGHGSDWGIKKLSQRNGGIHQPENRLIILIIPVIAGTIACVLYGQGGSHGDRIHWFSIIFGNAAQYFSFVGASITAMTYSLDAYPQRAAPILVLVCAMRGIINFGVSYGIVPFVARCGYNGTYGIFGGLTFFFGALGIPMFIYGSRIRAYTAKYTIDK